MATPCFAESLIDGELDLEIFRPSFSLAASATSRREATGVDPGYLDRRLKLRGLLPLIGSKLKIGGEKQTLNQLFTTITVGSVSPEISTLPRQRTLYQAAAGLTWLALTPEKNVYLASASLAFAEDSTTFRNPSPGGVGAFLGTYRTSDSFLFLFGAVGGYTAGKAGALPALGLHWTFESDWTLQLLLPSYLKLRYRIDKELSVNAFLKGSQYASRFSQDGEYPGRPGVVSVRLSELRTGLEGRYIATENLLLAAEVGFVGARTLGFFDGGDELQKTSIQGAGYASLFLQWQFGEPLMAQIERLFPR